MMLSSVLEGEVSRLRDALALSPRIDGIYQLELVDIRPLRTQGCSQNEILDVLYDQWVDHKAHQKQREKHPEFYAKTTALDVTSWQDYEVKQEHALEWLTYGLRGGGGVGHTTDTISPEKAEEFAQRFFNFFSSPHAYSGMALGDPSYVFENGLLLLDDERAGLLLILEND